MWVWTSTLCTITGARRNNRRERQSKQEKNGTASFVVDYNIAEEEEVDDMSSVLEEGLSFEQDILGSYDTAAGPFDVYGPEENR